MLLPAVQYGDWKEVRPRMRAMVKRLMRGDNLVEVMTAGGMLDTETTPGLLVVSGMMQSGPINFHCLEPWKMLYEALAKARADRAVEDAVFQASMATSWGVLGLMSPSNTGWFAGRSAQEAPFLKVAMGAWSEMADVGARYSCGFGGMTMWDVPSSLKFVLARMGIPIEKLNEPLPRGGPTALLEYAAGPN